MLLREVIGRPAARWISLAGLGVAVGAAALVARPQPAQQPQQPVRAAIRIDCAAEGDAACTFAEGLSSDVWSEERGAGVPLDVVVDDAGLAQLALHNVRYTLLSRDIDADATAEQLRLASPTAQDGGGDWFAEYRDYRAITTHLHELAERAPDRAAVQPIGSSLEGRTLWALRIGGTSPDAKPMIISGTQHAREWIAAMTSTCVADRLVRDYDRDPAIKNFVDHTQLWVVPVVNPDGYQYSWTGSRYWRKNRRDGYGVDLNRNFGVGWGGDGASTRKSSETYRGAYAFSEPESAAIRDLALREHVALHVDFHAYGQLLLYPWGYTAQPAKDRALFAAVGDRMASAMFAQHETRYTLQSAVELYPASGVMTDWMYGEAGALSYTIELRPKRGNGFVLPPDQIRPTCDEGLAAVLALRASMP